MPLVLQQKYCVHHVHLVESHLIQIICWCCRYAYQSEKEMCLVLFAVSALTMKKNVVCHCCGTRIGYMSFILSERISFPSIPELIRLSLKPWLHGYPANQPREITKCKRPFSIPSNLLDFIVSNHLSVPSRTSALLESNLTAWPIFWWDFIFLLLKVLKSWLNFSRNTAVSSVLASLPFNLAIN